MLISATSGCAKSTLQKNFHERKCLDIRAPRGTVVLSKRVCNTDSNLDKERIYTDVLVKKQVDGILFIATGLSTENIQLLQDREIPLVIGVQQVPEENVPCV
ncbi:hypothetical protein ACFLUA_04055 [Chloroflexota bacterium]